MFDAYKGTRKLMPEELLLNRPGEGGPVTCHGVLILTKEGYEVDDILGTIAKRRKEGAVRTILPETGTSGSLTPISGFIPEDELDD